MSLKCIDSGIIGLEDKKVWIIKDRTDHSLVIVSEDENPAFLTLIHSLSVSPVNGGRAPNSGENSWYIVYFKDEMISSFNTKAPIIIENDTIFHEITDSGEVMDSIDKYVPVGPN